MDINNLENTVKKDIDQLNEVNFFDVSIIKKIKESYQNEFLKLGLADFLKKSY